MIALETNLIGLVANTESHMSATCNYANTVPMYD